MKGATDGTEGLLNVLDEARALIEKRLAELDAERKQPRAGARRPHRRPASAVAGRAVRAARPAGATADASGGAAAPAPTRR